MATIVFFTDSRTVADMPGSGNMVSVDGAAPFRILGNMSKFFKLDSGDHTVVVTSSNGQSWEISAYVRYSECLNIKVQTDRDSNIIHVAYKVGPEPPTVMFPKKLPK